MKSFEVEVFGKLLIAGEYSVLYGGKSLSTTVNDSLKIYSKKRSESFLIQSDQWLRPLELKSFKDDESSLLVFALAFSKKAFCLEFPLEIKVQSTINSKAGFGSSSALILALAISVAIWAGKYDELKKENLLKIAIDIQAKFQTIASGYDITNQFYGGWLEFVKVSTAHTTNGIIFPKVNLICDENIHIYIGGRGSVTKNDLTKSHRWITDNQLQKNLVEVSDALCDSFLSDHFDEKNIFQLLKEHRSILGQGPAYPRDLALELENIPGCNNAWSFKPTGAGGEDAFLLFGSRENIFLADSFLVSRGWFPYSKGLSRKGFQVVEYG